MLRKNEDTPPFESKELVSIISNLSLEERAKRFFDFWNFSRELQWAGIQMRSPYLTEKEVDSSFRKMMLEYFKASSLNDQ